METKTKGRRREAAGLIASLVVIFSCPTMYASGPWVPFVAQRLTRIYRLNGNSKQLEEEQSEVWLRDSRGSIYLRNTPILGTSPGTAWEEATLFDAGSGTTYLIDYTHKMVRAMKKGRPLAPPTATSFGSHMPHDRYIGQKTIAGVPCVGWRMVWAASMPPPNAGQPAGEMWVAPSLNFVPLAQVIVDPISDRETDIQVVSITAGREPDPELLRLPEGFQVAAK